MASPTSTTSPQTQKQTLYFAYGSNLSLAQMKSRCPTSSYHALSILKGWKWLIGPRGYANVVCSSGPENVVYGMLYYLEPSDEEELDISEGVPYAYVKRWLDVEIVSAEEEEGARREVVNALVYVDVVRTGEGEIREEYVKRMNRGIRDAVKVGMPQSYVDGVLRKWVREENDSGGEVKDPFHPEKMKR